MTVESTLSKSNSVSVLAIVCICFGFLLIATTALQWILVDFLTPFLMAPIMLFLWAGLAGLTFASIVYLVAQFRKNVRRAVLPLLINGVTFLILWWVPFTTIWLDLEFRLNYQAYNEVVRMVEDGRIKPNDIGLAKLPPEYRHISRGGGEIKIERDDGVTSVFFYTFRGVLDNFSGYMYRSNDTPPPQDFMGGDWVQIERMQPYWFFCASR